MGMFNAQPAPPATQQVSYPAWESGYLQNLLGAASNVAQTPYTPYPGPLVASPSDMTKQSWDMAQKNIGAWQPYLDKAGQLTDQASAPITSSTIADWLNPNQRYVTNALDRNLTESALPALRDQFVSAGQAGSSQNREMAERAARDTQTSVGEAEAGNYQSALNSLLQNRQEEGALGAQYGMLGTDTQQLGQGDVNSIFNAGHQQDVFSQAGIDASKQEFQQQQMWPYMNVQFMADAARGLPGWGGQETQSWSPYQNGYGVSPMQSIMGMMPMFMSMMKKGGSVKGALQRTQRNAARRTVSERPRYGALRMAA